jgi:hypothetical protein
MAFTESDLTDVEVAIRAVRDGTRKVGVSGEGGSLAYMNTSLPDLLKLRDAMRLEIDATSTTATRRPRVFLMRHRRGL